MKTRGARWLLLGCIVLSAQLALGGCAARDSNPRANPPILSGGSPNLALAGVWQGTSVSDCAGMTPCLGLRWISFTMLPGAAGGLDGFYRCEQNTAACESYNDRGVITGASMNQRLFSFNVEMPDDERCIFRSLAAPLKMEGRFYCKQRAIEVDRGVWRAEHSF